MKGHITKRSEDSYSVVVDIGRDPKTGKRKQKWYTVHGNKRSPRRHGSFILPFIIADRDDARWPAGFFSG